MPKVSMAEIMKLSASERTLLVQDLWDSLAAAPEGVEHTESQCNELDARLEAYHNDPKAGAPWEEVKARIVATRKRTD